MKKIMATLVVATVCVLSYLTIGHLVFRATIAQLLERKRKKYIQEYDFRNDEGFNKNRRAGCLIVHQLSSLVAWPVVLLILIFGTAKERAEKYDPYTLRKKNQDLQASIQQLESQVNIGNQ